MPEWVREARYAVRVLLKSLGFTARAAGVSAVAALLFGLLPTLRLASRTSASA